MNQTSSCDIAIIGMAVRLPRAKNTEEFWERIRDGENCISFFTDEELRAQGVSDDLLRSPNYVRAAPVLEDIESFDAAFFGLTPREVELMDPQQRIFLECCWEAMENAGYETQIYSEAVGVFGGARTNTYLASLLTHRDLVDAVGMFSLGLGNDLAFMTSRVSHFLNLRGPSCSLHTACSTSLVAVHLACESLLADECRMALAGGVAVNVPHTVGYLYEEGSVQSPDGCCRAFDAVARGTVFGSGAGIVVLKRLEDAIEDGDTVHAVIRGSAVNNDGSAKTSFVAPSVQGQVRVVKEALRNAGTPPQSISYVECHGTGTLLGDAIELRALSKVFGSGQMESCALGSVKSNLGHLDAAAGVTGLIKVVLSLKHKLLPPTLHYCKPNPQIDLSSTRFYINTVLKQWNHGNEPRRAGVSAFGVGGTNAHMVVEEAPEPKGSQGKRSCHLILLSARTPSALRKMKGNLVDHMRRHPEQELADVAYTLQAGRQKFTYSWSMVSQSREEVLESLAQTNDWEEELQVGVGKEGIEPGIVFLFPGQGAQYTGMGMVLYREEPVFAEHLDRCAEILQPHLGMDLKELLGREIEQTWIAQPALVAVEFALAQLWMSWGVRPEAMLGHSVGEYTAACVAGVMTLEEALGLVAERGRLMQQAPAGAMMAVSLPLSQTEGLLEDGLEVAAKNAPDLNVVSGPVMAIDELEKRLKEQRISCQRLHTSHGFHSALMEAAMEPFIEKVRKIGLRAPEIPFISCVTGRWIRDEDATDAGYWGRQLRAPVQFADGIREAMGEGGRVLLEVGPGQGLRRLASRQPEPGLGRLLLSSMPANTHANESEAVLNALGRLWEAGLAIDWRGFHAHQRRRRVPLPTYPFERKRYWIEPAFQSAISETSFQGKPIKTPDVSQWFWIPSWKLKNVIQTERSEFDEPGDWIVFVDDRGLGKEVASRLRHEGQKVFEVSKGKHFESVRPDVYAIDPQRPSDYREIFRLLRMGGRKTWRIVHFWATQVPETNDWATALTQIHNLGLLSVLELLQAISSGEEETKIKLWVVVSQSALIETSDTLSPGQSGLLALCRVAPQETEGLQCSVIDIVPGDSSADIARAAISVTVELKRTQMEPLLAHRGHNRWVQHYEPSPIRPDNQPSRTLSTQGTYLITGGLGAVGLQIARHLAASLSSRVILISRTALPPREQWPAVLDCQPDALTTKRIQALLALEQEGLEVEAVSADVTNFEEMQALIDSCYRRFRRIDGIIHGAGLTHGPSVFCAIKDLTRDAIDAQFQAKAYGLHILHQVIKDRAVPFVLMLSSNASVLGGLGFSAYAAANAFMDAFAVQRTAADSKTVWISANWDHWSEETKQLKQFRTSMDEYSMTRAESLEATSRILRNCQGGQIIVSTANLEARLQMWVKGDLSNTPASQRVERSGARNARPRVKSAYVAPANETQKGIASIWGEILGLEKIGIHDDFFELGGHSLLATKLVEQLRKRISREITLTTLFEGPTVARMAETLARSTSYFGEQAYPTPAATT